MSTRNLPGGKGRPALRADNLTAICEPIVKVMWEPRRLTTLWASTACYRDRYREIQTGHTLLSHRRLLCCKVTLQLEWKHSIVSRFSWHTSCSEIGHVESSHQKKPMYKYLNCCKDKYNTILAGRHLPPGRFLIPISLLRGWVGPRAILRLYGLGK
jgi:hypothetical protein